MPQLLKKVLRGSRSLPRTVGNAASPSLRQGTNPAGVAKAPSGPTIRSRRCWSRVVLETLVATCLVLLTVPLLATPAREEAIWEKLEELERRLALLETCGREEAEESRPLAPAVAEPEVEELERRLEILAAELEKLRSAEPTSEVTPQQARRLGLAPSAASAYGEAQGVSIAGYGEMVYQNFASMNQRGDPIDPASQFDFLRAVFYTGYRFNDRFVFNLEVELEHAQEASLEFAYLDYLASPFLTVRGGLLLVPMGLTNEFHEPNVLLGALRPQTETRILPTTWRKNGVGVLGSAGAFDYRLYAVNGLNAAGFAFDGLRSGRQKGSRARSTDVAVVGRLDVAPSPGVFFGGSFYGGGSGQGQFVLQEDLLKVRTLIGEVHTQVQMRGLDFRGLYARATLDQVAELNQARGLTGTESIGDVLAGGYLQLGYDLLKRPDAGMGLTPYYRFEKLNTQASVPAGYAKNPTSAQTLHVLGLEYRPIYNVVVKSDYQWNLNRSRTGLDHLNIALGYAF